MRALSLVFHSAAPKRRAASSRTMKPTLWRVSLYLEPGFPRPTKSLCIVLRFALRFGLRFGLGFGIRFRFRYGGHFGGRRRRGFDFACGARGFDRYDDRLRRRQHLETGGELHLGCGHVIVYAQRGHVDLDFLGQRVGRALHFEFVEDDVKHGAGFAHAVGDADGDDAQQRVNGFGCRDALQIGVHDAVGDRIALEIAQESGVLGRRRQS